MRVDNFLELTTKCGLKLKTTHFPCQNPKATVIWFHAYGSYMSKYAPVVEHFTKAGYEVVGFDMRGFGESEGERGLIVSRHDWIDDAAHFLRLTHEW